MSHRVGFTRESEYQGGVGAGQAEFVFSDGLSYVGQWVDNKYEGQGKVEYSKGGGTVSFDGAWKANKHSTFGQEGYGTQIWTSGSVYKGEWKDGLMAVSYTHLRAHETDS